MSNGLQVAKINTMRIPVLSRNFYNSHLKNPDVEEIIEYCRNSFKEQINFATSNLDLNKKNYDTYISCLKYLIRASSRTTPFGMFCSVMNIEKNEETDMIPINTINYKRVDVDSSWLFNLRKKIEKELDMDIFYTFNDSILDNASTLTNFWITDLQNESYGETINKTNAVIYVKSVCSGKYIRKKDILNILKEKYTNIDKSVIVSFVNELIKFEFLLSNLKISLICENILQNFMVELSRYSTKYNQYLKQLQSKIKEYEVKNTGDGYEEYQNIIDFMENLVKNDNYLTVNLFKNEKIECIYNEEDIVGLLDFLLNNSGVMSSYNQFCSNFIDKYGQAAVRLIDILDEKKSIGLPKVETQDYFNEELIEFLELNYDKEEINLDELGFNNNENKSKTYNNFSSCELAFNIYKKKEKVMYISTPMFGTYCSTKSSGRFKSILNSEKINYANIKTVEISIHPKIQRLGNIITCNTNADYILEIGNTTNVREKILLSDIYVIVRHQKIFFYSKEKDVYLKFVMNNMVNLDYLHPIAKFLILASNGNEIDTFYFKKCIDYEFKKRIFTPRITYKNFVLYPKTWKLSKKYFGESKDFNTFFTKVNEYIKRYHIPNLCYVGEIDNLLLLNIDNKDHIHILYKLYKKNKNIILIESFDDLNSVIKGIDGEEYNNEVVFSLINNEEIAYPKINKIDFYDFDMIKKHTYLPLDGWVYYELHVVKPYQDDVLIEYINEFLNKNTRLYDKFFFIRYNENGDQLRLRFKQKNGDNSITNLCNGVNSLIKELYFKGLVKNVAIDTYERELYRYGGESNIDFLEDFFYIDSLFALQIIKLIKLKNLKVDKEAVYVLSVIDLFEHINVNNSFLLNYKLKKENKEDFRSFSDNLKGFIDIYNIENTTNGIMLKSIFEKFEPIYNEINNRISKNILSEDVLFSITHMRFIRLIGLDRTRENILMQFVEKILYSKSRRAIYD